MNIVKGFRFHPTDEELIEYLQIKTFDRDSLVQVIDEVQDICESEPWELPGRSNLQTRDRLWYFMYPPKYKYRNSKRVSRTTMEGYWKLTGKARKIIDPDSGVVIGSKKTLVFYKGQCNDKNKNKTCWVMHEYELRDDPAATVSDRKTYNLCKLKKKAHFSGNEAGRSSQHSLCNSENHEANNELLNPNGANEPEASNESDNIVHNKSSSIETYAGERSNQHNIGLYAGERSNQHNIINEEPLHIKEVSTEQNGPNEKHRVQDSYSAVEQDHASCNSVLTTNDETVSIETSNQPNKVVAAEGFQMPSNVDDPADEDSIPMDLLYNYVLSLHELLEEPEATNNSDWTQKPITNTDDDVFLNSIFADNNEAHLQEGNRQQCLAADNEGFNLPGMGMKESSNSMEISRKRPRLEYDGLSHDVETEVAQPWGEEDPYSSESIQADSYKRMVSPRIEGSMTKQQ